MELISKLQRLLEGAVENREIAGGNLLVFRNGVEIAYIQSGYACVEERKHYNRDSVFHDKACHGRGSYEFGRAGTSGSGTGGW